MPRQTNRALVTQLFKDAQWLSVAEAAADATVSITTIRRAYEHGHLVVQRFGVGTRNIRIRRADLLAWWANGGKTSQ